MQLGRSRWGGGIITSNWLLESLKSEEWHDMVETQERKFGWERWHDYLNKPFVDSHKALDEGCTLVLLDCYSLT